MNIPLVSICCLTYNHEKYIRDAIEGFISQETDFQYEIIIHDDASTDRTAEIIREYEKLFPDLIFPIYQKENQWSKGIKPSPTYVWPKARGKYIALCEGDDYWTDPLKLQKQVDFLEANPDYSICFHSVKILDEMNNKEFLEPQIPYKRTTFTINDLIERNFMHTPSLLIRNGKYMKEFPDDYKKVTTGDWYLTITASQYGKIHYIKDYMAVYRKHSGGIFSQKSKMYYAEAGVRLFEVLKKTINSTYSNEIKIKLDNFYISVILHKLYKFELKEAFRTIRKLMRQNSSLTQKVNVTVRFLQKVFIKVVHTFDFNGSKIY